MKSLSVLIKKGAKYTLLGVIGGALVVLLANLFILSSVSSKVYSDIENVDYSDVALVLGTSSSVNGRTENPFFTHRISAAAELFFQGKVKHILVSGDNSSMHYNEPRDMRHALIKLGVPDSCITMDFAGLRTLDSVVRSHKIFQQKRITIVSQGFHNYRALFIAQYYGIDAVAYNAAYPTEATMKTVLREYLARPKALLDLYLFDTQPKFLGDKITIRV
jgi:SanA protein